MARPNQEAIETFMSITGVSEATAIQKLEVVFFFLGFFSLIMIFLTLLSFCYEFILYTKMEINLFCFSDYLIVYFSD